MEKHILNGNLSYNKLLKNSWKDFKEKRLSFWLLICPCKNRHFQDNWGRLRGQVWCCCCLKQIIVTTLSVTLEFGSLWHILVSLLVVKGFFSLQILVRWNQKHLALHGQTFIKKKVSYRPAPFKYWIRRASQKKTLLYCKQSFDSDGTIIGKIIKPTLY